MSASSQKEWSVLLQTKIIIRVLGLFWTYPSPVSFFPSTQLPSKKEKRKFFTLSRSRRRQWEKYIKAIHVDIHVLLCWILGRSQSCVIGLRRKPVKDSPLHSQTALSFKKSLFSIWTFCWEMQKVFLSFFLSLFLLLASTWLQARALGHWSLQRTFVSGRAARNGASDRLACYWSKAPGTQVATLYLAFP